MIGQCQFWLMVIPKSMSWSNNRILGGRLEDIGPEECECACSRQLESLTSLRSIILGNFSNGLVRGNSGDGDDANMGHNRRLIQISGNLILSQA